MAYCHHAPALKLCGELAPSDLADLQIRIYSDSDWAGDGSTSKSTSGIWLELYSPSSGRSMPISWAAVLQPSSASSTAEAETTSASYGMRRESIPVQVLLEAVIGVRVPIRHQIDNSQAKLAIERGYSKRLRHLQRTQRVCVGLLHESLQDPSY